MEPEENKESNNKQEKNNEGVKIDTKTKDETINNKEEKSKENSTLNTLLEILINEKQKYRKNNKYLSNFFTQCERYLNNLNKTDVKQIIIGKKKITLKNFFEKKLYDIMISIRDTYNKNKNTNYFYENNKFSFIKLNEDIRSINNIINSSENKKIYKKWKNNKLLENKFKITVKHIRKIDRETKNTYLIKQKEELINIKNKIKDIIKDNDLNNFQHLENKIDINDKKTFGRFVEKFKNWKLASQHNNEAKADEEERLKDKIVFPLHRHLEQNDIANKLNVPLFDPEDKNKIKYKKNGYFLFRPWGNEPDNCNYTHTILVQLQRLKGTSQFKIKLYDTLGFYREQEIDTTTGQQRVVFQEGGKIKFKTKEKRSEVIKDIKNRLSNLLETDAKNLNVEEAEFLSKTTKDKISQKQKSYGGCFEMCLYAYFVYKKRDRELKKIEEEYKKALKDIEKDYKDKTQKVFFRPLRKDDLTEYIEKRQKKYKKEKKREINEKEQKKNEEIEKIHKECDKLLNEFADIIHLKKSGDKGTKSISTLKKALRKLHAIAEDKNEKDINIDSIYCKL